MPDAPPPVCRCGHDEDVHLHYRHPSDTDCSICGPAACPGFRPDRPPISPGLRRALLVTAGVPALVLVVVGAAIWLGPAAAAGAALAIAVVAALLIASKE